jgi:HSP20 family protein
VSVGDGVLTITGQKRAVETHDRRSCHLVERQYGVFTRSVLLPAHVAADQISASLSRGVLQINLPAPGRAQAKRIEVKATS